MGKFLRSFFKIPKNTKKVHRNYNVITRKALLNYLLSTKKVMEKYLDCTK